MKTYLVQLCKIDGTTPLGGCPEYEIEAKDYYDLLKVIYNQYLGYEIVSWGNKRDIEQSRIQFVY